MGAGAWVSLVGFVLVLFWILRMFFIVTVNHTVSTDDFVKSPLKIDDA